MSPRSRGRGLRRTRHEGVVDLPSAADGVALAEAGVIAHELWAPLDRAERHPPAEMRGDIDVRRAEAVADQVLASGHRLLKRVQDIAQRAVARHGPTLGGHVEPEHLVRPSSFKG